MIIRKIYQFLWYLHRDNFEKKSNRIRVGSLIEDCYELNLIFFISPSKCLIYFCWVTFRWQVCFLLAFFWRSRGSGTARIRLEFDLYLKCVHRHLQRVGRHLACELTLANAAGIVRNNLMLEYIFPACMLSTLSDDLSILFLCMIKATKYSICKQNVI